MGAHINLSLKVTLIEKITGLASTEKFPPFLLHRQAIWRWNFDFHRQNHFFFHLAVENFPPPSCFTADNKCFCLKNGGKWKKKLHRQAVSPPIISGLRPPYITYYGITLFLYTVHDERKISLLVVRRRLFGCCCVVVVPMLLLLMLLHYLLSSMPEVSGLEGGVSLV